MNRIRVNGKVVESYPAQIVFTEADRGWLWRGRLLNKAHCIDTALHNSMPVLCTPYWNIREMGRGFFVATTQGGPSAGGRRHRTFKSLTEAQQAGIRWAARRFRVVEET